MLVALGIRNGLRFNFLGRALIIRKVAAAFHDTALAAPAGCHDRIAVIIASLRRSVTLPGPIPGLPQSRSVSLPLLACLLLPWSCTCLTAPDAIVSCGTNMETVARCSSCPFSTKTDMFILLVRFSQMENDRDHASSCGTRHGEMCLVAAPVVAV
ncbi:uncharacterized protein B0I36DRAFT_322878 [Microdochium trichocladiopsis]|uniref:Uncharacterized protein n=1 Tax=Microdochium trichocladiopsis TaxID=1682393 RepID=A0A9P8Y6A5_9PEZI|nr:uncharacterized protein B0I36DRAFT_322878 [Microdochium trichocladiopsis]KAH7030955.1 hypothetical protein B0I36DRAFT_322878 [Microdochium trichocladiopsis]